MPNQDERKTSLIDRVISRRRVLAGMASFAGLAALPGVLAACGSGPTPAPSAAPTASSTPAASAAASGSAGTFAAGTITLGSDYTDQAAKAAIQALAESFTTKTEIGVTIGTTEPGKFQDSISAYLHGTPDDIFTWFAGYRMQSFAAQRLVTDISDVWQQVGSNFSDANKAASTGPDGKPYLIPFSTYAWVVMYRKSLWSERGYPIPKTESDFTALMDRMKKDGLTPLAFGDGWPAMGVFDILDMRLNGHDFHIALMSGNQKWTDPKVKAVFQKWGDWLGKGYFQDGATARTWQDAVQAMIGKRAGMCFLGTTAGAQATDAAVHDDLDCFAFPTLGTTYDPERAIDAPIDGFMISSRPGNVAAAKAFLEYLATGEAQVAFLATNPNLIAPAKDADTSKYSAWQKKIQEVVSQAQKVAQFFDRDTRPDFAGTSGMQGLLRDFVQTPTQDLDAYLVRIQSLWDSLPPLT